MKFLLSLSIIVVVIVSLFFKGKVILPFARSKSSPVKGVFPFFPLSYSFLSNLVAQWNVKV